MSSGKEEAIGSTPVFNPRSTVQLAQLILACHAQKPLFNGKPEAELAGLIMNNDVTQLAYWLQFNSFLRYQLQKIMESANAQELSDTLIHKIHERLADYFHEQKTKKTIATYEEKDFVSRDYVKLHDLEKLYQNLNATLDSSDILPILNAKNRRQKEMGRSGILIAIRRASYASEATARKFARILSELAPGERKQYVYYHKNGRHTIGFDVERDRSGSYRIFCFESAADPKHFEALDLLYKELNKRGLSFEIKSCQSQLQKDTYNCSIYTLAALSELSKYDHVFDYLPSQYEEVQSLKTTKKVTISTLAGLRTTHFDHMDKISWVPLHAMPIKIIAMAQSYDTMSKTLQKSKDFDVDPEGFLDWHKKKFRFEPSREQETKYVNQRRKNIVKQLNQAMEPILKSAYTQFINQLPLLAFIDQGETPDFKKEISDNPSWSIDEKLAHIEKLFFAITRQHQINPSNPALASVKPHYLMSLLLLRHEYLRLLSLKPREEYEKYFKEGKEGSILRYALEKPCSQLAIATPVSLQRVFKASFPKEFVNEYYMWINTFTDLQITNPLLAVFTGSIVQSQEVVALLDSFEKEYVDGSDASLMMTTGKLFEFLHPIMADCLSYNSATHLLKASAGIEPVDLLESIESHVHRAFIFSEDGQCYFYHKDNTPPLRAIDVNPASLQKVVSLVEQEIKIRGENTKEVVDLNNKPVKTILSHLQPLLNDISLLTGSTPYSDKEIIQKRNLLMLREIYLNYLFRLFNQDKKLALDYWSSWKSELFAPLKLLSRDYPLSQNALDAVTALNNAEKSVSMDNNNTASSLSDRMSNALSGIVEMTYSFFKPSSLRDIVMNYYVKESKEEMECDTYEKYDKLNFKLKLFQPMERDTRWVQYERCHPPVKPLESDWKFNVSIHKDDLSKAFPVVAEIANRHGLGVLKIMTAAHANRVHKYNNKNMIGREIVIYRNPNLDIRAAQWIEIINELESGLKKTGIRTSTDRCPSSNRQLGKYTSYTHEAWTDSQMNIPFAEGIVETALEEDDPFADYEYNPSTEAPASKTITSKKPG